MQISILHSNNWTKIMDKIFLVKQLEEHHPCCSGSKLKIYNFRDLRSFNCTNNNDINTTFTLASARADFWSYTPTKSIYKKRYWSQSSEACSYLQTVWPFLPFLHIQLSYDFSVLAGILNLVFQFDPLQWLIHQIYPFPYWTHLSILQTYPVLKSLFIVTIILLLYACLLPPKVHHHIFLLIVLTKANNYRILSLQFFPPRLYLVLRSLTF